MASTTAFKVSREKFLELLEDPRTITVWDIEMKEFLYGSRVVVYFDEKPNIVDITICTFEGIQGEEFLLRPAKPVEVTKIEWEEIQ